MSSVNKIIILVFVNSEGKMANLFLLDLVQKAMKQ